MSKDAADLSRDEILGRLDVAAFYSEYIRDFKTNGTLNVSCHCPFHDDGKASFSVHRESGLYKCHGCSAKGSPVDFLMAKLNIGPGQALSLLAERVNGGSAALCPKSASKAIERRRYAAIPETRDGATKAAVYDYTLNGGTAAAVKVRYVHPDGTKTFRWFERKGDGFLETLGGHHADLYQFEAVRAGIERGALVILNEGEKAVERLMRHDGDDTKDFVGTCGPNGADSFKDAAAVRLAAQLAGAHEVLAVVDRDAKGDGWAEQLRRHLETRVLSLRFVRACVTTEKADLYDHLEGGHTLGELIPLAESADAPIVEAARLLPSGETGTLAGVVETFQRWQYLPDPTPLHVVLAAYVANKMDGDPIWILVVAPSGTGKTEVVMPLAGLSDVHLASTLTEASLLSGTAKRDKAKDAKGGLLREIGDFGILLVKDFTSILSMNRDARAQVLGALREVYDGNYVRHVGTDGGRSLSWSGRVGLIGAVTPVIDRHHTVLSALGERFLYFRLPEVDRRELGRKALSHARTGAKMRGELTGAVQALIAGVDFNAIPTELSEAQNEHLLSLANFATLARSAVERDGHSREIELIVGAEAPTRLAIALSRLLSGLRAIGVDEATAWRSIVRVGLDSIPAIRRTAIAILADGTTRSTREVGRAANYPTGTARRALEDLAVYDVVERDAGDNRTPDEWRLSNAAADALGSVPEMSAELHRRPETAFPKSRVIASPAPPTRPLIKPQRVSTNISGTQD